jgi:hypothetical protein
VTFRALLLALSLLPQEDFAELKSFEQAWPREKLETLRPLAQAVVQAVEKPERTIDPYRNRWIVDVLIRAGDVDYLKRLEAAFEKKADARSLARALETRGERIAATGDVDALFAHLQEKLKPPAGKRHDSKWYAFEFFLDRVHKAGKIRPFIDRLMETPADHADFRFHADVLTGAPSWFQSNSERNEMHHRLREKEKGAGAVSAADRILVATQCADEKKFAAAMEKARAILDGNGRLSDEERASTEQVVARCLIESGDAAGAVAACDRGLAVTRTQAYPLFLVKARARLAGGDASGAVAVWRESFASLERVSDAERRWAQQRWMAAVLRSDLNRWKDRRAAVAEACGTADLFILAAARELGGNPAGAAEALDRLHQGAPGNLAVVFERLRLHVSAGQMAQGVAARLELLSIEADLSDRKKGRRVDGLPELEKLLITACEDHGAWDALKALGLGFAADPGWHHSEIEEILNVVREPDYLAAVEKAGLAAAKNEMQRWWAMDPVIRACHRLGWNDETTRRLKTITVEHGFAPKTVELAASWIEDFSRPEVQVRDPLEVVREKVKDAPDAPDSFRVPFGIDPKQLDRSWRAGVRGGSADPTPWKLGAILARTEGERLACLEKLVAAPAWKAHLGVVLLDAGQEARARELLIGMIRSKKERAAAGAALESCVNRLQRDLAAVLAKEFEQVDAVGWVWVLSRRRPESVEKELELLERWWSRAPEGDERRRAGRELAQVLQRRAESFLEAKLTDKAAAMLERAADVSDDVDLRVRAFDAYGAAGNDAGVLRTGFALLPVRRAHVRAPLQEALLRRGPELWKELRAKPHPAPTAEAAAEIRRELDSLRDDRPEVRDAAAQALRIRGPATIPLLLDGIDDRDADYKSRVRNLIVEALLGPEAREDE